MKFSRIVPQPSDQLHPGAWWLWAFGCALSATNIKNPLVLMLLCISIMVISISRMATQAQRQSFLILFKIALWFIALRIMLQTLLGYPIGSHIMMRLPSIDLPTWLSGLYPRHVGTNFLCSKL
jgi:energy-coupling factor transport system permease protein